MLFCPVGGIGLDEFVPKIETMFFVVDHEQVRVSCLALLPFLQV